MRLLLDTHVWLWAVTNPERLNSASRDAIESATELVFSVASLWEIAIKHAAGKLRLELTLGEFRASIARMHSAELTIHSEHAMLAARLPPHHRDPFDRMLVAQAKVEDLTLATADAVVKAYDVRVLWVGD
jgi:PIN domain nuclease of toxin-antitoxin system